MPRVYELPTHLEVEDQLIAGLTARHLLRLLIGASLAYGVWDQVLWLPEEVRLVAAVILTALGGAFALLQPQGRPLDQWLVVLLLFLICPRQLVWKPGVTQQDWQQRDQTGWAELELHPEWLEAEHDPQPEHSARIEGRRHYFSTITRRWSPFGSAGPRHTQAADPRWLW
jgi:hypothetical protein